MMAGGGASGGARPDRHPCGGPDRHIPVMLAEVLAALQPANGETYIDGTFGAGGYSSAILAAADSHVIAIDRDPTAIAGGTALAEAYAPRLTLVEGVFSELDIHAQGAGPIHGVVLDIGVSSMQLDQPERGFSFLGDGPLDMRMGDAGPTAADIVNGASEALLADIFFHLGEERRAYALARAIVEDRGETPFLTTRSLAELCARVVGRGHHDDKHPATRAFQALRIYVNDELGELERALFAAERVLAPGGRLVVVSFHSLEDRIIKQFFATRSGLEAGPSRYQPARSEQIAPSFQLINRGAVKPTEDEVAANPRARSAKLRSGVRTAAAPWPETALAPRLPEHGAGRGRPKRAKR